MANPTMRRTALAISLILGESFLSSNPDTNPLMQKKHIVMVKFKLNSELVKPFKPYLRKGSPLEKTFPKINGSLIIDQA
jgi:hypothetical protein